MPLLPVRTARTFRERLVGWMGRRVIGADEVLLFPHCRSVHTFGMRVPIDIVMLDGNGKVLAVHTAVQPWRIVRGPPGSASVLEAAAGTATALGIVSGEIVRWHSSHE